MQMMSSPDKLSFRETLQIRLNNLGSRACRLHYEAVPLKVVRGSKQYLYDDVGNEYLDCVNYAAHVGHCHPHVVAVGQKQMGTLTTAAGFLNDSLSLYAKRLLETLPEKLQVCFFLNSGSEANDLALRLARAYTKAEDIIVTEHAFHGNMESLIEISPQIYESEFKAKKDYVHVVPCPDTFRGKFREDSVNSGQSYAEDVLAVLDRMQHKGRKVAGFLCEPIMALSGVIVPPAGYLETVYSMVRQCGGVCIADEVAVGMGRVGGNYWAFQSQGVVPDIVTCGKPMGNGYPMSAVITTREIADCLPNFNSGLGGNPVSCSVGMAVLDVIKNEQLLSGAKMVGHVLLEAFRKIQPRHPTMGDVRGQGLIVGVEIVTDKASRSPAKDVAELLAYKMKQEKVLLANGGPAKNVMTLSPPMCFNCDNARHVVEVFDRCLSEIETGACPDLLKNIPGARNIPTTALFVPESIVSLGDGDEEDDEEEEGSAKRPRYDDLD